MVKASDIRRYIKFIEYFLTTLNVLIFIRVLALVINIDYFRDDQTGKLTLLGEKIKFIQVIIENITNPVFRPFENILMFMLPKADVELISILAPIFIIIFILFFNLILKLLTPYIIHFIRDLQQ